MVVGLLRAKLAIPSSRSLKDKRAAIRPLLSALARELGTSAAEVDHQDVHQHAEIAVAIVSADRRHANSVLSHVHDRLAGWSGEAVLEQSSIELIDVGDTG